jgi:uncharacterized protein (TIGR01244 family)
MTKLEVIIRIVKLTETVAVSQQIAPEHVADIAAAGYQVLINNRPDGESPDQPASAEFAAAAEAAGLEYHYFPVTAMNFPGPNIEQMADLLDDGERPVLAFCRSGTRCANLWVASRQGEDRATAQATASRLGYDLGMASRVP